MPDQQLPRRDAGSRTFVDVLRHPLVAFSSPFRKNEAASTDDVAAVLGSEGRVVSCFLRGTGDPFPRRLQQGGLHLTGAEIRWAPGLRLKGGGLLLTPPLAIVAVRPPRGWERLRIGRGVFKVVELNTSGGELTLGLPSASAALVVQRLEAAN
jgi:hypothetical protein